MALLMFPTRIRTEGGTLYEPWTDGRAIGYKVTLTTGSVKYIFLNPSDEEGGPDSTPDVFVYIGPEPDPRLATAAHFYDMNDDEGDST
jgi:hypothetical protein